MARDARKVWGSRDLISSLLFSPTANAQETAEIFLKGAARRTVKKIFLRIKKAARKQKNAKK